MITRDSLGDAYTSGSGGIQHWQLQKLELADEKTGFKIFRLLSDRAAGQPEPLQHT